MLDTTFAALSDPTRRGILEMLQSGDRSVGELVDEFPITQSAVSRHLQVLEHAGLVTRQQDGQRRLCRLNPDPLQEANEWIETYRVQWEARFDRLDALLTKDTKPAAARRKDKRK